MRFWTSLLLLLTNPSGLRANTVAVEVNARKAVAYLSPLIYGINLPSSAATWLVPASASHGARLVRVGAEYRPGTPPDLTSLTQTLQQVRMNGMTPLLSFGDGPTPEATQTFVVDVLKGLIDVAGNITFVVLPDNLSGWILGQLRGGSQPSPLLPFQTFTSTTFYLSLTKEQIPTFTEIRQSGQIAGKFPLRVGLAISDSSELIQEAGPSSPTDSRQAKTHRSTPVSQFCPVEFSPFSSNSEGPALDNNVLHLASALTDLLRQGVSLAVATAPSQRQQTNHDTSNDAGGEHLFWLTPIGLYDLFSDWGSLYGYQVVTRIDPPLKGYAAKSPGRVSLCLINLDKEDHSARIRWTLGSGVYGVETRALLGREGCPRPPKDEDLIAAFASRPSESTLQLPAGSVTVVRCRNEAFLANRSIGPLLDLANGGALRPIPTAKRALIRRILNETSHSVQSMLTGGSRIAPENARSVHRSLLRMAQVEAMLKNYALQGALSKMDYNRIVGALEDVTDHLSAMSAQALHVRLQMSCADRIVEPGRWFRVEVKASNLGHVTLRHLRFFIEAGDEVVTKPACDPDRRSLAAGATTTCSFLCQVVQPARPRILEAVTVGVTYYAYQSYARLRREVEVAVKR